MSTCVFCERPITADTPSVGRPPIAAHAACADTALADDRHWDEIATGTPEPDEPSEAVPEARTGGCLVISVLLLVAAEGLVRRVGR